MFNIHDPKGMKRLFQLRVGLSPLNYHKKRHNFKDTLTDSCRCKLSPETTKHFLIYCNLFTKERYDMFQVINPLLESKGFRLLDDDMIVKLLLYGHDTLNETENTAVLSATLKFIHESSRFDLDNE